MSQFRKSAVELLLLLSLLLVLLLLLLLLLLLFFMIFLGCESAGSGCLEKLLIPHQNIFVRTPFEKIAPTGLLVQLVSPTTK